MRVCHRLGRLIGESQQRVARAKPLPGDVGVSPHNNDTPSPGQGDEVDQLADLTSIGWKSPLDRRLRSRMATGPFQFTGMKERNTPESELLPEIIKSNAIEGAHVAQ